MYLIIGGVIGLLGFLISMFISDMRNMKSHLRVQQDAVRRLEKRTQELQMMLGDVIAKGQIRDMEKTKMLGQMKSRGEEGKWVTAAELKKAAESRPGETDQELLLR